MFKEVPIARGLRLAFSGGLAGIALIAAPAFAQTTTASDAVQQGERVEITGSSIKRIDAETALPVQVITRDDIQRIAPQNTEQLLRTISATNSVGSIVTANSSGATTGSVSAVSLRGLGSQRTLVLVNGRRLSTFGALANTGEASSVDVNAIPIAAIERIEVLKDGASAIYGSDAIAGVINFILRSDFQGLLAESQYGQTTHSGDGRSYSTDAVVGFGNLQTDKFNVMLTASYSKDEAIYGRDRAYANNAVSLGGANDSTSGNTYPGNIVSPSGATRNFAAPGFNGAFNGLELNAFPTCAPATTSPLTSTKVCRYNTAPFVPLVPDQRRTNVSLNAQYAITPSMTAYLELQGSRNITKVSEQASPISDAVGVLQPTNPFFAAQSALLASLGPQLTATYGAASVSTLPGKTDVLLPASSPYYPTAFAASLGIPAGSPILVRYRTDEAGGRQLRDESTSGRGVGGIKGTAFDWDYDVAGFYGQSRLHERTTGGYELYSKLLPLLDTGTVNLFGPSTPAAVAALKSTVYNGEAYNTRTYFTSVNGHASREIFNLPAGPISLAVGTDLRREAYQFNASDAYSTGDITGYGGNGLGINRSRSVEAGFLELNVPIIKGLELDLAARYDNYENVGNTVNPKASIRWQPVKQFLLRASVGTGFRAPALDELYAPVITGLTGVLSDPLRCPTTGAQTDCGNQYSTKNGGNTNLQPEKSTSLNYGFQIEPTENVHLGVDYFDIKLRNTISDGGVTAASILANAASANLFSGLVTRGPSSGGLPGQIISIAQIDTNLFKTHTRGLDFDFKFRAPTDIGRFTLALNGTYFLTYDNQNQDGSYTGGIANADNIGGLIPRWKHIASLTYDYGPWSGTLYHNFQSAYTDQEANLTGDLRKAGVYETFDLQASYSGIKGLNLTVGVKNLMDKDPPYSNVGGVNVFQAGYDPAYADPHGRFVYARVSYLFK
jgi:iron complex outermembrane receptor protein